MFFKTTQLDIVNIVDKAREINGKPLSCLLITDYITFRFFRQCIICKIISNIAVELW